MTRLLFSKVTRVTAQMMTVLNLSQCKAPYLIRQNADDIPDILLCNYRWNV